MMELSAASATISVDDRRQYDRVSGPFDGLRLNALETPVRIYDLSEGGCFVNSLNPQQAGVQLVLKIDLPNEGWVTLKARTLYVKPEFGFAVRFTGMTDRNLAILKRAIERLKTPDEFGD